FSPRTARPRPSAPAGEVVCPPTSIRGRRPRPRRRRTLRPLAPAAARHGGRARTLRGERGPGSDRARARPGGEPRWLASDDPAMVLHAAGIECAHGEQVAAAEAEAAAERLGFPLVAKAVAPGLVHKSDVGGVVLGLESPAAVARAVATLRERMD